MQQTLEQSGEAEMFLRSFNTPVEYLSNLLTPKIKSLLLAQPILSRLVGLAVFYFLLLLLVYLEYLKNKKVDPNRMNRQYNMLAHSAVFL